MRKNEINSNRNTIKLTLRNNSMSTDLKKSQKSVSKPDSKTKTTTVFSTYKLFYDKLASQNTSRVNSMKSTFRQDISNNVKTINKDYKQSFRESISENKTKSINILIYSQVPFTNLNNKNIKAIILHPPQNKIRC
jgi:hypothetical protein